MLDVPVRPRLDARGRQGGAVPAVPRHRRLGRRARDLTRRSTGLTFDQIIVTPPTGWRLRPFGTCGLVRLTRDAARSLTCRNSKPEIPQGGNMKKGVALLLAILATAAVAASAQGGRSTAVASSAISCKSTLKIGFVAPFTGGAGFLGNEQISWAQYAVKTLAKPLGLKIRHRPGRHSGRAGPCPRTDAGAEVRRRQERRRDPRTVDVGCGRRIEPDVLPGRAWRTSRRRRHGRA